MNRTSKDRNELADKTGVGEDQEGRRHYRIVVRLVLRGQKAVAPKHHTKAGVSGSESDVTRTHTTTSICQG